MAINRESGTYETVPVEGESVRAFIPHPLPPSHPTLVLDAETLGHLRSARGALRDLEVATELLPSHRFVHGFIRKEAVVSCQMAGARVTLLDLLTFEAGAEPEPSADLRRVGSYLDALGFGRTELPLSIPWLNEIHRRLMQGEKTPTEAGEPRRSQSWVGNTRPGKAIYVPPPPDVLAELLSAFEAYMNDVDELPPLIRAGLLHAQLAILHPYLDGNGRLGRLVGALLLERWGLLREPLFHLSLSFNERRDEYHRRLTEVRTDGDWEGWTRFFLEAVATTADEALSTARDLNGIVRRDRQAVLSTRTSSLMGVRLFETLPEHPILTIGKAMTLLTTTRPTAAKAVGALVDAGVLAETSGKRRDRTFAYAAFLDALHVGMDRAS